MRTRVIVKHSHRASHSDAVVDRALHVVPMRARRTEAWSPRFRSFPIQRASPWPVEGSNRHHRQAMCASTLQCDGGVGLSARSASAYVV